MTAVNIDGAHLAKVPRGDRWVFDERIPEELQAGPEVYADNDLDRGHLVRRNDPVWGEPEVAARANDATFHFTNAAPQASGFNQGGSSGSGSRTTCSSTRARTSSSSACSPGRCSTTTTRRTGASGSR